jgi:hypothetical protein
LVGAEGFEPPTLCSQRIDLRFVYAKAGLATFVFPAT